MDHWSKTSCMEPQPVGKHRRRDRDADAGYFRGTGKFLRLMNGSEGGSSKKSGADEMTRSSGDSSNGRRSREGTAAKGFNQEIVPKTAMAGTSLAKKAVISPSFVQNGKPDARETVMLILNKYRSYCENLEEFKHELNVRRIDCASYGLVKKDLPYLNKDPILGSVPGIEVGEEFKYRMELHLVCVHRPIQCGIDTMGDASGDKIAISVIDSGGYDNYITSSDTLVYCAQGSSLENQKKKTVNQAMMKSKVVKNPVRVIRTRKVDGGSTTYFYDGLYIVEDMWQDRKFDGNLLRFKLVRIPGQPSSFPRKPLS